MYTEEQVLRAIETLVGLGHSYSETVRELGYPSVNCLRGWWRDYEANGAVVDRAYHREPGYGEGRRRRAVEHYLAHGRNLSRTMRELGYPGRRGELARWIDEPAPGERRVVRRGPHREPRPRETMAAAVAALEAGEGTAEEVAERFGATTGDLRNWRRRILGHNGGGPEERGLPVGETRDDLPDDVEGLLALEEDLRRQVRELRLEIDVPGATRDVAKKTRAPTRNG